MTAAAGRVLARMDEELRSLWSTPPPRGEPQKARACTMNLVVVAATPALADEWLPVVDAVIQNVPARALVIGLDPDAKDDFEGSVSAVCTPADRGGGPLVCSERVKLVASGALCDRLPSCVDALCATDVPLTLVWLARVHAADPAFTPLARQASRIVLDATRGSLASLAHVVRWASQLAQEGRPGVADLAWTRLASWQELCARMFDPIRLRPLSRQVTSVTLVQAASGGAGVATEGALLLGWLATRLGWKASSLAGRLRLVRPDGGHVQVLLRAQAAPLVPPGTLIGVNVQAGADDLSLRGEIERGGEGQTDAAIWRLQVTSGGRQEPALEQHTRLRGSDAARLLERTLHRPPRDEALADAVGWADELRGEELACT